MQIELKSELDTKKLAIAIGALLKKGDFIALTGDLGAGKTAFSRFLIQSLEESYEDVPSPTFTLVQFYDLPKFTIWHFDLYRVKNHEEVYELGWEDAISDGVCLVEWPERAKNILPEDRIEINFSFADSNNDTRVANITFLGNTQKRFSDLSI